ncbi:hypothetical protein K435DRAFT_880139 [Dendrothele bispora CBS 962.96]|uniref:Uncharacterized protein n=1 Tax=Dendrothele bispora (strain CBS 962.96) TaxID=1314807 RepID=A0A4S8KJX5_DENBC|nr:hypothetical protein K435DRAFT_880139 [Dendrothele bispora CBS 962.96]
MTANVTFILDSQDLHFSDLTTNKTVNLPFDVFRLTPNNTRNMKSNVFYRDSLLFFNGTNETEYNINFDGSSISLFGYALGEVSKNFTVDQSLVQPNNLSQNPVGHPDVLTGGQFPSSPFQGRISGVQQMGIDYALVTATNTSNLEDKTIFVDDDDAEITWSGWTRQADRSYGIIGVMYINTSIQFPSQITSQPVQALPHGNSVHQSNTQGDSFVFKFAGESILVGGFTPGTPGDQPVSEASYFSDSSDSSDFADSSKNSGGALTMKFDVDGNSTLNSYFTQANETSLHFIYFSDPDLSTGNHTLTVTIHSVSGDIFAFIDYITYKPIFSTLADKPDFSDSDPTTGPSPDPNSATGPSPDPDSTISPSSDPNTDNIGPSQSHDSAAVIVGAAIGSLLLITILVASLWFLKRRWKKQQQLLGVVEPFTMPVSEANLHPASDSKRTGEILRSIITTHVQIRRPVSAPMQPDTPDSAFSIISSNSAMPTNESPAVMVARIREMEAQIELMSREMQQHIVAPPTYQSECNS